MIKRVVIVANKLFSKHKMYSTMGALQSKNLQVKLTDNPKPLVKESELVFGTTFTDHMLKVEWTKETGWKTPMITPYSNLSLPPSSSVFHYAFSCFEGMKAYLGTKNEVRMFRPFRNLERLNLACERLCLPTFDTKEMFELLKKLILVDKRWVPKTKGYSLYLRPIIIGTQESIGVVPSNKALMYAILSPVGSYFPTGFKAVKLFASDKYIRAWPGGTGSHKVSGNYSPGILPQKEVHEQGYQQILWLFEDCLTEVGSMNCFVYLINKDGEKELCTPILDGTISPGITRETIITLARRKGIKTSERKINISEIKEACRENRMLEMFGSGTACLICPIKEISHKDEVFKIPTNAKNSDKEAGPLTNELFEEILKMKTGAIETEWSIAIKD